MRSVSSLAIPPTAEFGSGSAVSSQELESDIVAEAAPLVRMHVQLVNDQLCIDIPAEEEGRADRQVCLDLLTWHKPSRFSQ